LTSELVVSSVLITLALVFYTLGVWAERLQRYLKPWHVVAFWTGLVFDTAGTYAMSLLTEGGMDWGDFHTLTGQLAIWLMFGHAVWATWVVWKGTDQARASFHRYSLVVWLIWLVPYFGGAFVGMGNA
jgi:uncharacterized repeat protein (TIGR03987 family)